MKIVKLIAGSISKGQGAPESSFGRPLGVLWAILSALACPWASFWTTYARTLEGRWRSLGAC